MTTVAQRARDDLAAGRAWKARDRLQGALAVDAPPELVDLLGEVLFGMGDLPEVVALQRRAEEAVRQGRGRRPTVPGDLTATTRHQSGALALLAAVAASAVLLGVVVCLVAGVVTVVGWLT
jgi:hypothetical protein